MQLYYNETLSMCVCVSAFLHCMNGAARNKREGTNPLVDFMSPVAMAKYELEGHEAIGAKQRKHLHRIQRERGNCLTIALTDNR